VRQAKRTNGLGLGARDGDTSLTHRLPPDPLLFLSGLFFGGALDHAILAAKRSSRTPYGMEVGVAGNWAFAGLDLALAVTMTARALHRRKQSNRLFGH